MNMYRHEVKKMPKVNWDVNAIYVYVSEPVDETDVLILNMENMLAIPPPKGPWTTEPDEVHWTDQNTSLTCMLRRSVSWVWCGYVGLTPEQFEYFLDATANKDDIDDILEVHGGITFRGELRHNPGGLKWYGFDCAHGGDCIPTVWPFDIMRQSPRMDLTYEEACHMAWEYKYVKDAFNIYRTITFAKKEVEKLAKQLSEYCKSEPPK